MNKFLKETLRLFAIFFFVGWYSRVFIWRMVIIPLAILMT